MEFVILVCVNIAMFAVFYLVISLKLERSASEFREKRLRKVMDDIITEFNETSERNISILENKISVMKRLLDASGDLKSIDISVADEGNLRQDVLQGGGSGEHEDAPFAEQRSWSMDAAEKTETDGSVAQKIGIRFVALGRGLHSGIVAAAEKCREGIHRAGMRFNIPQTRPGATVERLTGPDINGAVPSLQSAHVDFVSDEQTLPVFTEEYAIEKDYNDIKNQLLVTEEEEPVADVMTERELKGLFTSSDDKYNLISDLFDDGYSVELLSRSSGVPVGEIRLVLNLNNS